MSETSIDATAEAWVRGRARDVLRVRDRECACCFIARMLDEFGCDNTLRFAIHYRDAVAPRATGLERRLGAKGGFCDCEIFLNAYAVHQRFWTPEREAERDGYTEVHDAEPPDELPACAGVRRGSTEPCANWERRGRGMW